MISVVNRCSDFRFMLPEGTVAARVLREVLKRLMIDVPKAVFLIMHDQPVLNAVIVKKYVEQTKGMLKLFELSLYAPYLNPDGAQVKLDV